MASVASKINGGALPPGFSSPLRRIAQSGSHDCLLACAATLAGKSLEDVKKTAVTLGMRENGPFNMHDEDLFRKILFNISTLSTSAYLDFTSIDALPDVCVLACDWSKFDESYRHVVFHHIRAHGDVPSFHYVIDVAPWVGAHQQVTTDLSHLNLKPAWYLEIKQRPNASGKGK